MSIYSTLSFLSQGDVFVSFELIKTKTKGLSEIRAILYGEAFPFLDIALEYRLSEFDEWKTDAKISSGPNLGIEGNIFRGLQCSSSGTEYSIYWNHLANGLPDGNKCEIRLKPLHSPVVFLSSNFGVYVERPITNELEASLDNFAVNTNRSGDYICMTETSMDVVSREDKQTVLSVGGLSNPAYAIQKPDGNYLILDSGNNLVIETTSEGATERTLDISSYVDNPIGFAYDDFIGTILVTGGYVPKVYEFTWGDEYGDLLWSHGDASPGSGENQLDSPFGVSYGDDRSVVYVADFGNNRVVGIDRKTDSVSIIDSVTVNGVNLAVKYPKFLRAVKDGSLFVLEMQGEEENYARNIGNHPAIQRFLSASAESVGKKDDLPEYGNLMFSPLLHTHLEESSEDSSF